MKSKICDSVCKRKYNFVLKGAGISTEISNKKYKILLDRVDVITAYQVYNECNQKQNKERCVIDLAPIDFVNIFKKNCKFTPTIVLEDISFSPFYIGKITCACITKDEQLCLIVDCNGFKSKSRFNDEMPVGELKNVRIQIDPTPVSSNTTPTSGTFIFNLDTSEWNASEKIPVINDNGSFSQLYVNAQPSIDTNDITVVSIDFTYTTISDNDGLSFGIVPYVGSTSLTISQFGSQFAGAPGEYSGIPLSRGGNQFYNPNIYNPNTKGNGVGFRGKITAQDVPKILSGTSLSTCFSQAGNYIISSSSLFTIAGIEYWNMSNVVNMNSMFYSAYYFNTDIGKWDTSGVTDMSYMFHECNYFNQDIGNWNTSNVTNMSTMFEFAGVYNNTDVGFNSDIGSWDVSNVTNMDNMFFNAFAFNQDLSRWCVSKIRSEPSNFKTDAPLTPEKLPIWGTCPSN